MKKDVKYSQKTSYRINDRIKTIIDNTCDDVRKETGLSLSLGKVSRAFWVSLAQNPELRKRCIDYVCKTVLEEIGKKDKQVYRYNSKNRKKAGYDRK